MRVWTRFELSIETKTMDMRVSVDTLHAAYFSHLGDLGVDVWHSCDCGGGGHVLEGKKKKIEKKKNSRFT